MSDTNNAKHERTRRLHPLVIRIMHWTNALAIILMIMSGWKIYNDEVLFGWLHFPEGATIGGEAQGALQWHFFAMWILMLNGLCYLVYTLSSGRFRRMLLPIYPRQVIAEVVAALRFHPPARRPYALQCRAEGPLCRHHPGDHPPGHQRSRHLEADPVFRTYVAVLRFPDRAACAFPVHGGDLRVHRHPCGPGAAGAEDDRLHDHGRSARAGRRSRTPPSGRAMAPDVAQ